MRKSKKELFDFDQLPAIMGSGVKIIEKELKLLTAKSEQQELSESESKKLISYLTILREIKKDYLAEVSAVQKELKEMSTEQLAHMLHETEKMAS